jgi:hypothetical protein
MRRSKRHLYSITSSARATSDRWRKQAEQDKHQLLHGGTPLLVVIHTTTVWLKLGAAALGAFPRTLTQDTLITWGGYMPWPSTLLTSIFSYFSPSLALLLLRGAIFL